MNTQRYCKKCLLDEIDDNKLYSNVMAYVDNIPADDRASPEEYARRLKCCKACRWLVNGLCSLCGCFVEIRAAKARQHCAHSGRVW